MDMNKVHESLPPINKELPHVSINVCVLMKDGSFYSAYVCYEKIETGTFWFESNTDKDLLENVFAWALWPAMPYDHPLAMNVNAEKERSEEVDFRGIFAKPHSS